MVPNFFDLYGRYTKTTEPPPNFHAWSALGAISALLGKKCFIPQGTFTVYPNLYIILVGSAGSRKSTAKDVAREIVGNIDSVPLAPESSSREALIDDMAESKVGATIDGKDYSYWQSAAFVDEMQQFLGGKHLNQGMVGFLTAIWSSNNFKERTRKSGKVVIPNPYFSLLGCCTTTWVAENLKAEILTDGFARRAIFVYEDELNCLNAWPVTTPDMATTKAELIQEAHRIARIQGQFGFTVEAMSLWHRRYKELREEAKHHSEKLQNYFSTKHILAQKISMCISAATRSDRLVDCACLSLAFSFLNESEKSLDTIFSGVGQNRLKAAQDRVLNKIIEAGTEGVPRSDLLKRFYDDLTMQEFTEVCQALIEMNLVEFGIPDGGGQPVFRVAKLEKRSRAVNLLELAGRITPSAEACSSECEVSVVPHRTDPEAVRTAKHLEQRKVDLGNGILLRRTHSSDHQPPVDLSTLLGSEPDL
jgi:hypothetical protein